MVALSQFQWQCQRNCFDLNFLCENQRERTWRWAAYVRRDNLSVFHLSTSTTRECCTCSHMAGVYIWTFPLVFVSSNRIQCSPSEDLCDGYAVIPTARFACKKTHRFQLLTSKISSMSWPFEIVSTGRECNEVKRSKFSCSLRLCFDQLIWAWIAKLVHQNKLQITSAKSSDFLDNFRQTVMRHEHLNEKLAPRMGRA